MHVFCRMPTKKVAKIDEEVASCFCPVFSETRQRSRIQHISDEIYAYTLITAHVLRHLYMFPDFVFPNPDSVLKTESESGQNDPKKPNPNPKTESGKRFGSNTAAFSRKMRKMDALFDSA